MNKIKDKKILITGACGFIGFHLCKLLLGKYNSIIGIDNINNYYSTKIKKNRLKILKNYKNFVFEKIDISNVTKLKKIFKKHNISIIINLAAQAGVSYSMKYPEKYFKTNISGFFNICNLSRNYKIKKIIYASSSSIYGDSKKLPVKETINPNPLNYYAISKFNNEQTAKFFSQISKIKFIGLRFFSIYGPFGRPDMLIYKILDAVKKNKKFYLNNFGNHSRDFTYIDDTIKIISQLINKNQINSHEIFNICNSKSIKLNYFIKLLFKKKIYPKIIKRKFQKGDIKDALGCNKKIKKFLKINKLTKFNVGLEKTLKWYEKNKRFF